MIIRSIEPSEKDEYRSLALAQGSVFNDPDWAAVFGDKVSVYGIFGNDGKLIGGFFLGRESFFGIPYYSSPPHTPSIGLFYANASKNPSNRIGREKEILSEVSAFLKKRSFAIHRYCLPVGIQDMQPFIWDQFKVIPHYTYHIDLSLKEEELRSRLSDKLRNNIRKATADGIRTKEISSYEQLLPIIEGTFDRQKLGVNKDWIRKMLMEFSNPGNSFAAGTFEGETMLGMAFCVHDRETAYYLFGGVTDAKRHEGAGAAALWEAVRLGKARGLRTFDLEGSMIRNVEKFFRGFGGELKSYYTLNRAPFLVECGLKLFKRELF